MASRALLDFLDHQYAIDIKSHRFGCKNKPAALRRSEA